MRTTVNLRPEALELCKRKAKERGVSLGEALSDAVLEAYRDRPNAGENKCVELPVSTRTGGTFPGVNLDNNAELEDIMDGLVDPA